MSTKTFLTDAQLKSELSRCEHCAEKPCFNTCPAGCSPYKFIQAALTGEKSDVARAAAEILTSNPLGGICGLVCPDKHCMSACTRARFDAPVNIPAVQATLVEKAKRMGVFPSLPSAAPNGKKVAVLGAGPAGLAASAVLAQKGYSVDLYDKEDKAGGACRLIPRHRLPVDVIDSDLKFVLENDNVSFIHGTNEDLKGRMDDYDAIIVAAGLHNPRKAGVPGEELAVYSYDYLRNPSAYKIEGPVAIVGGGAIATDCAVTARINGAPAVEMFVLEKLGEMPLTDKERAELMEYGIDVTNRTKVTEILSENGRVAGVRTRKIGLKGDKFIFGNLYDIDGSDVDRREFRHVIYAIGNRGSVALCDCDKVFPAGDIKNGPSTVVEAVASGKNAALEADAYMSGHGKCSVPMHKRCDEKVGGYNRKPVSLEADFFGRKMISPFILSAAPPSDGYEQMRKAYEAGWAGGVMKTSFDDVPIHIPGEYMFRLNPDTYANCDNVSGHPLKRVCEEVKRLVREYPDRLTLASTGGPVTGNDEADKRQWQKNTRMLEEAGAMGIEYSLSCPQGGDGTEGDIVSQNAGLTAKIIDWVMEVSNPDIPKIFKLTAQVTSIKVIVNAIKKVFDKYPGKKAGITLANTFPSMAFRKRDKKEWEEGVVIGMSGRGVANISNLTLSTVAGMGLNISGNGGPMNYLEAAHFLALGVTTVQFCTIVMKNGYDVIEELEEGLSCLMKERGISSVKELIGIAVRTGKGAVTDFMSLTPVKKISSVDKDLCIGCGCCTRCSYLAIKLDESKKPVINPERCIGCSICVQKCIAGALSMRERTPEEAAALKEA